MEQTTYWLWYGSRCLTSIKLDAGSSDEQVRFAAAGREEHMPIAHDRYETPYEFNWKLWRSEIRVYNDSPKQPTIAAAVQSFAMEWTSFYVGVVVGCTYASAVMVFVLWVVAG